MKAEEVVALWCEVFGSTDDVSDEAKASLVERVRTHANEALELAAKVADAHECGGEDDIVCQHQNCAMIIAASILALKE